MPSVSEAFRVNEAEEACGKREGLREGGRGDQCAASKLCGQHNCKPSACYSSIVLAKAIIFEKIYITNYIWCTKVLGPYTKIK